MTQKNDQFKNVMSYVGLFLIVVLLLAHVFYKEIDFLILTIPAMMIGLDITRK